MEPQRFLGRKIREYHILDILGQGGMAAVFLAEHSKLKALRAIKMIRSKWSSHPEFIERFNREARLLVHVMHPNLVQIHDFFEEYDHLFLVMTYVPGESLATRLKREGVIRAAGILPLVAQALDGLREAHRIGIVHRDISPGNIMLMPLKNGSERAVIIDFGIAKSVSEDDIGTTLQLDLTQTGRFLGKLQYCSPEQVRGRRVDARSDIYSLGITLFRCLTGKLPFKGKTPVDTLSMRTFRDAPLISDARPDLHFPSALTEIVRKATTKNPLDRFQTAQEFKSAIIEFLHPERVKPVEESTEKYLIQPDEDPDKTELLDESDPIWINELPFEIRRERSKFPWIIAGTIIIGLLVFTGLALFFVPELHLNRNPDASGTTQAHLPASEPASTKTPAKTILPQTSEPEARLSASGSPEPGISGAAGTAFSTAAPTPAPDSSFATATPYPTVAEGAGWTIADSGVAPEVVSPAPSIVAEPTSSPVPTPVELFVSTDGGQDYKSISEAVSAAAPGTIIHVLPGTYFESLRIDKKMEIRGGEDPGQVVVVSRQDSCLKFHSEEASVQGITFNCNVPSSRLCYGVEIHTGVLSLTNCIVSSNSLACVAVLGKGASVRMNTCRIFNSSDVGVLFFDHGRGDMLDCDIYGNAFAGVLIMNASDPTIERCKIHDGHDAGIWVKSRGKPVIDRCRIYQNKLAGILVSDYAEPEITECRISEGEKSGLFFFDHAGGVVKKSAISRNGYFGVKVLDESTPQFESCAIENNVFSGVKIGKKSVPVFVKCRIKNNGHDGIVVSGNAIVHLQNCEITGNVQKNVRIEAGSEVVGQTNGSE